MQTVPSAWRLFSRLFGGRLARFWSRQSLAGRFTIASLAVLGCGMTLLGAWVSSRIEEGVLYNSASSAALYINTFIDPQVQELARGPNLRAETVAKLDELLNTAPLRRKVVGIKIWSLDNIILYSNKKEEVGHKYPPSWRLQEVKKGRIVGSFETREDENSVERKRTEVAELLKKAGVSGIFNPGTPMDEIAEFIRKNVKPRGVITA